MSGGAQAQDVQRDVNLPPAPAPTHFVDGANATASDDGPGSKDKPWKTLAKAAATAKAGDVVLVAAQGTLYAPSNLRNTRVIITIPPPAQAVVK